MVQLAKRTGGSWAVSTLLAAKLSSVRLSVEAFVDCTARRVLMQVSGMTAEHLHTAPRGPHVHTAAAAATTRRPGVT